MNILEFIEEQVKRISIEDWKYEIEKLSSARYELENYDDVIHFLKKQLDGSYSGYEEIGEIFEVSDIYGKDFNDETVMFNSYKENDKIRFSNSIGMINDTTTIEAVYEFVNVTDLEILYNNEEGLDCQLIKLVSIETA